MTLTTDLNKVLKALQQLEPKGHINLISGLRIAHVRWKGLGRGVEGMAGGRSYCTKASYSCTHHLAAAGFEASSEQKSEDQNYCLCWQSVGCRSKGSKY